jgi:hypothetical protein
MTVIIGRADVASSDRKRVSIQGSATISNFVHDLLNALSP